MPFVNEAQRRACWAQYNRDLKAGRVPKWDCHKWAHETKKTKKSRKSTKKTRKSTKKTQKTRKSIKKTQKTRKSKSKKLQPYVRYKNRWYKVTKGGRIKFGNRYTWAKGKIHYR